MTAQLREAEGLLFVGDPHLTSVRPGRRKDADFGQSVLDKIAKAVEIANEQRLILVLTGDLFDQPKEEDQGLITRLIRCLAQCWTWSISNVGNHDIANTTLSDKDSLGLLHAAGVLHVATESGGVEEFLLGPEKKRIGLGMTPYGQAIPHDVTDVYPEASATIWVTHHDLLFKDAYPGSAPLHEIAGCGLAINGHVHLQKPIEQCGKTKWFNPGNITRMSIDALDHVPAVWAYRPGNGLEKIEIPDAPDIFDLTGYLVTAAGPNETIRVVREEASAFVELLRDVATMELGKSDDGSLLQEEIEAKCETDKAPPAVRAIVLSLLHEAVVRNHAA